MQRGRFAPSPTGPLHFGSLIAAVGSFLEARRQGGEWVVRIEDIDTPRVVTGAADVILKTLENYGLYWDGTVIYQSQRIKRYQEALDQLLAQNMAYPCSCSRREIALIAPLGPGGRIYPGICRNGQKHPNRKTAIRLCTDTTPIQFYDRLQGSFTQQLEAELGDFVIRRADSIFAYQLAVVIDDADQDITDIVRGCDLLDSTPRQIYLQRQLGLPTPSYCHLPIAVNRNGDKLSKQTGATPVDDSNPTTGLVKALEFLGQTPPDILKRADVATIWDWALDNWNGTQIPKKHQIALNTRE